MRKQADKPVDFRLYYATIMCARKGRDTIGSEQIVGGP